MPRENNQAVNPVTIGGIHPIMEAFSIYDYFAAYGTSSCLCTKCGTWSAAEGEGWTGRALATGSWSFAG